MIDARRHLPLLLCATILACRASPVDPPHIGDVAFAFDGIAVRLSGTATAVELRDANGQLVLHRTLCMPTPNEVRLPHRWQANARYLVRARHADLVAEQLATAPPRATALLRLRLPVFDAGDARELEIPASPGSAIDGMLEIRSATREPVTFTIDMRSNADAPERFTGELTAEGEVWFRSLKITAPTSNRTTITAEASWQAGAERTTARFSRTLVPRDPALLARLVSIVAAEMPADITGARDLRLKPDSLHVPGQWSSAIEQLLHLHSDIGNLYQPVTWQRVALQPSTTAPALAVEVHSRVVDEHDAPVSALGPPDLHRAGVASTRVWTMLSAGEERVVTLPVYADLTAARPGHYTRIIALHVPGEHEPFLERRYPLEVLAPHEAPLVVTIAASIAAAVAFVLAFRGREAIFRGFTSRDLVLAALIGATSFAIVTLPEIAFFNIVHALLGPLSVVFTGLLTGVVHYTLLACLLVLAPRRGMIALVLLVKLLLAGIIMGQISLVALLYASTNILLLEMSLRMATPQWLRDRRFWITAAAIAGAQGAAVLINFQVSKTLYRFYFADWFVVLSVLVDGTLYTWIGCCAGRRIGHGLLRVTG